MALRITSKKEIISICVRTAVILALILILLYIMRENYGKIWQAIRSANLFIFLLALAAFALALVTASMRLKMIIETQGKAGKIIPSTPQPPAPRKA